MKQEIKSNPGDFLCGRCLIMKVSLEGVDGMERHLRIYNSL